MLGNQVRLQHAPRTDVAAGLRALGGAKQRHLPFFECRNVLQIRRRCPHGLIHGWRQRNGAAGRQTKGGEQIIAVAVSKAGNKIRAGGRYHNSIAPAGQFNMPHGRLRLSIQQIQMHRLAGQRLQRQWGDKGLRSLCHDNAYIGTVILKPPHQLGTFIGGNAPGNPDDNPFVGQSLHNSEIPKLPKL